MLTGNQDRNSLADQEQVTFDQARAILLNSLASTPTGANASNEEINRRRDVEVETLVQIGAFMVDRWAAETVAARGQSGTAAARAASKAKSSCSGLHFHTTTENAHQKLRDFQDRHREVMPASIVRSELAPLAKNVAGELDRESPKYERPFHWRWFALEGVKGFVGLLGVIVFGTIITLAVSVVSPRIRQEVISGMSTLLGAGNENSGDNLPRVRHRVRTPTGPPQDEAAEAPAR